MESLDPRIQRLDLSKDRDPKKALDQLETYEAFLQLKDGKPYKHAGGVHASDEEMAWVFAKEQYSRRLTCTGLWVVRTSNVYVSKTTENVDNIYSHFTPNSAGSLPFEVFHLLKRGKQHVHAGCVMANNIDDAFGVASKEFGESMAFNIWIADQSNVFKSDEDDIDIWSTLPEKKFRDAIAYRAGDKLKNFLEKNRS